MAHELVVPPKIRTGDRVAVVSPSFAAPAVFPHIHERALRRLHEDLGVEPVEYPTTRRLDAPAEDRAADLMAAFADPDIGAVLATIGGDDQITVLPHLDPAVMCARPKPFFGYSDNTNLLNWLWSHGVAGYHGGSTMVHLGGRHELHPVSVGSLRAALFSDGDLEIGPVDEVSEDEVDWSDPATMDIPAAVVPGEGWTWHQADRVVTAPAWGGNLEVVSWNLAVGRWMQPAEDYAGCILLIETSEELPSATAVFRILRNAGERGLLGQFAAVVVARAKSGHFGVPADRKDRRRYREAQRESVLAALSTYNREAMAVFGVDFGHTDPQWVLPYGGLLTVDGPSRKITAHYRAGTVAPG